MLRQTASSLPPSFVAPLSFASICPAHVGIPCNANLPGGTPQPAWEALAVCSLVVYRNFEVDGAVVSVNSFARRFRGSCPRVFMVGWHMGVRRRTTGSCLSHPCRRNAGVRPLRPVEYSAGLSAWRCPEQAARVHSCVLATPEQDSTNGCHNGDPNLGCPGGGGRSAATNPCASQGKRSGWMQGWPGLTCSGAF